MDQLAINTVVIQDTIPIQKPEGVNVSQGANRWLMELAGFVQITKL